MDILIVGAGQVGRSIGASLSEEHDVVMVEKDPERIERIKYELDVLTVEGDGIDIDVLREAGVENAGLVIACTSDDRTNILICAVSKMVSNPFTIARVAETGYLETWRYSRKAFGVDLMVGSDFLTARTIVRVLGLKQARDVEFFAHGEVEMAEFVIPEGSTLAFKSVREADVYPRLTFAALFHEDQMEIVSGDTRMEPGDRLVVIGPPGPVNDFALEMSPEEEERSDQDIVIFGGGEIGFQIARLLERQGLVPRLVELNPERAREIAEKLPETVILVNDATRLEFLNQEYIGRADVVVSALRPDERNVLAVLLARRLGVSRVISVVHDFQYVDLFDSLPLDAAVNPREEVAEEITRFTRRRRIENIAILEKHQGEVIEMEASTQGVLTGRPIEVGVTDLPQDVVIGAIAREGEFIMPRGDTVVRAGDHVVLLVRSEQAEEVSSRL